MRLWHYKLIPYLPDKQLRGQWREIALIKKALDEGTLNHCIVNRVKDYPKEHFIRYTQIVADEMHRRGFKADWFALWRGEWGKFPITAIHIPDGELFGAWHNTRYLIQCYMNLEEKYDCGAITQDEFLRLSEGYDHAAYSNAIAQIKQIPKA